MGLRFRRSPFRRRRRPVRQATINAIHEADVGAFLGSLGLLETFDAGHLTCIVCHEPLKTKGLGAVVKTIGAKPVFACSELDCLETFYRAGS